MSELFSAVISRRRALGQMAALGAAYGLLAGCKSEQIVAEGTAARGGEQAVKVVWMVKRKPGLSVAEFRDAYRHHVDLIVKHIGPTFTEYRLNFPNEAFGGIKELSANEGYISGPIPVDYDCITEMLCPDRAAYEEGLKIAVSPEVAPLLDADEGKFIDRGSVITWLGQELKVI